MVEDKTVADVVVVVVEDKTGVEEVEIGIDVTLINVVALVVAAVVVVAVVAVVVIVVVVVGVVSPTKIFRS